METPVLDTSRPSLVALGDRLFGILVILIGIGAIYATQGLDVWNEDGPGARLVPLFAAALMIASGFAVALRNAAAARLERSFVIKFAVYMVLMLACIAVFDALGAVGAFLAFFVLEMVLVEKYPMIRACIVSAITIAALYLVFAVGLQMSLPRFSLFG
jgi:Tripartite tricarboxylate transporter TctB family